ncbi:MAG: hypothetical protein FE78DRAFT_34051 [Acidomyces sp. 'richmondensis']|nr:MAG: hypothetical protein FE78DRAFT_34051 [Acidomyces sp. 'richmondensis']
MSSNSIPRATLADKLGVLPLAFRVLFSAITRLLTYPLRSTRASTLFKDVVFAALRTQLSVISPAQEQWLNSTTEAAYLDVCKKRKIQPDTDVTGKSGLKLHWLGPKKAKKVVIYYHGGGYVLAASPGHIAWLFDLQEMLSKEHSVAIVVPAYTLAPHGQYPMQLREGVEALDHVMNKMQRKPGDIILGGDSAGGNLTLGVLFHLLHPKPDVAELIGEIQLSEPLAGAVLISPWCKFGTDDDSATRNAGSDMVTKKAAHRWSSLFLGKTAADKYSEPIQADESFLSGLEKVVKDILVWGGGGEGLIDSIDLMSKKLREAHPRVEYVVQPKAAHEDFILEKLLGYKHKAQGTILVENWISARL